MKEGSGALRVLVVVPVVGGVVCVPVVAVVVAGAAAVVVVLLVAATAGVSTVTVLVFEAAAGQSGGEQEENGDDPRAGGAHRPMVFATRAAAPRLPRRSLAEGYDPSSMSSPSTTKPSKPRAGRSKGEMLRSGGLVILAILITLFAVFNLKTVEVNWIFGSGHAPLIIVIVVSVLVGVVLTYAAERIIHKRK